MLQQASGGGGGARSYLLNDLLHHAKPRLFRDVAAGVNHLMETLYSPAGTFTQMEKYHLTGEHAQCDVLTPP